MDSETTQKISSLYEQFKSHVMHAPMTTGPSDIIREQTINLVNTSIDELIDLTGLQEFAKFRIIPLNQEYGQSAIVMAIDFRQIIGGLIGRLHALYFSDKEEPFAIGPSTIIKQEQTTNITITQELRDIIESKLPTTQSDSKERKFLETMKEKLASIKNGADALQIAINTGVSLGLTLLQVKSLMGW